MRDEATQAPDIDAFVRKTLGNNSAETILDYCHTLRRRGDQALAQRIASSEALQGKVVPNSIHLEDGSYGPNHLEEGDMFESRFRSELANIGVVDSAA